MSIHHVISPVRYEGIVEHTNADFTVCGSGVSLLDDGWLQAWMAANQIETVEEALIALNATTPVTSSYKTIVTNDKSELTADFKAADMLRPGQNLLSGELVEQVRQAEKLAPQSTEVQILAALGFVDKRSVQAILE